MFKVVIKMGNFILGIEIMFGVEIIYYGYVMWWCRRIVGND